jgi:ubiquinone/menaquinone biosynthesis C-methylase UbiE
MPKSRAKYPGPLINNRDPEKHFQFHDIRMREFYSAVIKTLADHNDLEGSLLHVGCGTAAFEILFCDKSGYAKLYGLERSRTFIRIGEAVLSRYGYSNRIFVKSWEDELLPYPDNHFDYIVSLFSMHQWKDPEKTLKEIERVRKKKSAVFIADYRRDVSSIAFGMYARKFRSQYGKEISLNLTNAFKASYTLKELNEMMANAGISGWRLEKDSKWFSLVSLSSDSETDETGINSELLVSDKNEDN